MLNTILNIFGFVCLIILISFCIHKGIIIVGLLLSIPLLAWLIIKIKEYQNKPK